MAEGQCELRFLTIEMAVFPTEMQSGMGCQDQLDCGIGENHMVVLFLN